MRFRDFTTLEAPKFNDLELKFSWFICIVGKHIPTKENLKIYYFVSST